MDEYNQGMDPAVKRYFRKIVNSFVVGLGWMIVFAICGIYLGLAVVRDGVKWYNVLFYIVFIVTLIWLIRYFHKTWNSASDVMRDDTPGSEKNA